MILGFIFNLENIVTKNRLYRMVKISILERDSSREVYFMKFLKLQNSCFRNDAIMNTLSRLF